jgi:thioredoxin 1
MSYDAYSYKSSSSKFVVEVVESTFKKEILDSSVPVFLVAVSKSSDTCRLFEPLFLEIHKELGGNGKIAIMNFEKNLDFAKELGIVTTPVFIIYNKGKKLASLELTMSPAEIKSIAKYFLELNFLTSLRNYSLLLKFLKKIS